MKNITNNNSYLILYLIIILILLYAITFISGYTNDMISKTNIIKNDNDKENFFKLKSENNIFTYSDTDTDTDEETDLKKDKIKYYQNGITVNINEDFTTLNEKQNSESEQTSLTSKPLTINDFTLLTVGSDYQLYIQDIIGGIWNANSTLIENSGSVSDICITPSGSIFGVGLDNNIWFRQTLNSTWGRYTVLNGVWISVSILNDGHTLLLIAKNWLLYTFDLNKTTSEPVQIYEPNGYQFVKIIQLLNGQFFGVGANTNFYLGSGLITNIVWNMLPANTCCGKSVAQMPNGSIIIVGEDSSIWLTSTIGGNWVKQGSTASGLCCYLAVGVMPIPSQNINGYERKGAFLDNSTNKLIPNLLGNINTLQECIQKAKSLGYNVVGYQDKNQCYAGINSPYDSLGFQTDETQSNSAYPGALTNIVYKTPIQLFSTTDPLEGEIYLYNDCQFSGNGNKLTIGQYPNLNNSINVKSIKLGINTKLSVYSQPNYTGNNNIYIGYSDIVNKDYSCINFIIQSAKVETINNALPSKPLDLTNEQLETLWINSGCKADSVGFNSNITNWKNKNTISEVIDDMKKWSSSSETTYKEGCLTLLPKPNIPVEGEVVLFENCDFGGKYKKFKISDIDFVGKDFDNLTSSIKIGPFTNITIFENNKYTGKSATWTNNTDSISNITCLTTNNFDNMLSSLKISSSTAVVNYNLNNKIKPITILGLWNTKPWQLSNFIDKTAQWVWWNNWNGQFPNGSAPVDIKPITFQQIITISGNNNIPVIIHIMADNAPQGANFVKLNGKIIGQIIENGWLTPNYTKIKSVLLPGNNLLEYVVKNVGGGAGLLVSIVNSNSMEIIANSGSSISKWGWIDADTILSENIESEFIFHDGVQKGQNILFKNLNEIQPIMVGGTFRLSMNLTNVPPYIKGKQYKNGETNKFYLCVEKLEPNCQIQENNKCMSIFVDDAKCSNATLSNITRINSYRFVLITESYVLDPNIPFGKNVDFTLIKVGDKIYLKNIQTGYLPKLFVNDFKQNLYGYMDNNYLSNIKTLKTNENILCNQSVPKVIKTTEKQTTPNNPSPNIKNIFNKAVNGLLGTNEQKPKTEQQFVSCTTNADGEMYMITTQNLAESNPVKFIINKEGLLNIRLQQYNSYGNIDKTFSLIHCNFNINTYAFIEKLTNPLGTFFINMLCFDADDERKLPNNTLNFQVEISQYPDTYLKNKNIINLDS